MFVIQLTEEQLGDLEAMVAYAPMRDVLLAHYQDATIAIIRGFNYVSQQACSIGAYFNEDEASKALLALGRTNQTQNYHIVTGRVMEFERDIVIDPKTGRSVDDIGMQMAYALLRQALPKRVLPGDMFQIHH